MMMKGDISKRAQKNPFLTWNAVVYCEKLYTCMLQQLCVKPQTHETSAICSCVSSSLLYHKNSHNSTKIMLFSFEALKLQTEYHKGGLVQLTLKFLL